LATSYFLINVYAVLSDPVFEMEVRRVARSNKVVVAAAAEYHHVHCLVLRMTSLKIRTVNTVL
jgi:hypothetical protein